MCEHRFTEQFELDLSSLKEDLVFQPTQIIKETVIFGENLKPSYVKKTHTLKEKKSKAKLVLNENEKLSACNSVHEFLLTVPFSYKAKNGFNLFVPELKFTV